MEKENDKERKKDKKKYIETIKELISFVKWKDLRCKMFILIFE